MRKLRIFLGIGVTALSILVLAAVAAYFYLSRPERLPERKPLPDYSGYDLQSKVGWYEIGADSQALLTWDADGALQLLSFNEVVHRDRFVPATTETFHWQHVDEPPREVTFVPDDDGRVAGFVWRTGLGSEHAATRIQRGPYAVRELMYANGDVTLFGSLFIPEGAESHPAAVMIHGSGTSDRNNMWYMAIAHHLVTHGIAVVLPDKRGCGKSGGEWRIASFEDFAKDTRAAVEAVRREPGVDPANVGLVGISQGGWIAPLSASITENLAFVVDLCGSAVPPNEQLRHETRQTLAQEGLPQPLIALVEPLATAFPQRRRPTWWRANGSFDPVPYWRSCPAPALIVYGADDEQDNVPVARCVARLKEVQVAKPDGALTIHVYPGSGHGLYQPGSKVIRQDFLNDLTDWILANTHRPGGQ